MLFAEAELQRRFSFEFNGMRNHEYYFKSLEGGAKPLSDGPLRHKLKNNLVHMICGSKIYGGCNNAWNWLGNAVLGHTQNNSLMHG